MSMQVAPNTRWDTLHSQARSLVPEAFSTEGAVLNLIGGEWGHSGHRKSFLSPVDGAILESHPMIDLAVAKEAVHLAAEEATRWAKVDLDERKRRVVECLQEFQSHRELIAYLLVWEIGKPYPQSLDGVDRCISGVEWYVENIENMLDGRQALGLISNIASWNYPMSVMMHSVLVQVLAGNAVIAKTPSDGGLVTLTLTMGLARRAGLPVSLVSGPGGELSDALVKNDDIDCLVYVGGKGNGRYIAANLHDKDKRYILEMEGVNPYGVWDFSDWEGLSKQIRKGFAYGKQRCTAYPRYVVQRSLFPKFLEHYMDAIGEVRCGHPLLVNGSDHPAPALDFGPLINSWKVEELSVKYSDALSKGAVSLYEGTLDESLFLPGQDISAYQPPRALMNVPRNCDLYHQEPFGPIDTLVVVDTIEELINEMNVSGGSLVASVACDSAQTGEHILGELRSFKVGHNKPRSRGDRAEAFGGIGQSWIGCFVGGGHLVHAVTEGPPDERLYGNFPDYTLLPEGR